MVDDPVKRVDNMAMAWGLETRVPFLDHELVELAARIPAELKVRDGGKYILKEACARARSRCGDRPAQRLFPGAGAQIYPRRLSRLRPRRARCAASAAAWPVQPPLISSGCLPTRKASSRRRDTRNFGKSRCWNAGCRRRVSEKRSSEPSCKQRIIPWNLDLTRTSGGFASGRSPSGARTAQLRARRSCFASASRKNIFYPTPRPARRRRRRLTRCFMPPISAPVGHIDREFLQAQIEVGDRAALPRRRCADRTAPVAAERGRRRRRARACDPGLRHASAGLLAGVGAKRRKIATTRSWTIYR